MRKILALAFVFGASVASAESYKPEDQAPASDMTLSTDPRATLVAGSAAICAYQDFRREVLAEIREVKRYAKVGGALNLREVYDLQEQLRSYDDSIANVRRELDGRKPLSCKSPEVAKMIACQADSTCGDPAARLFVVVR